MVKTASMVLGSSTAFNAKAIADVKSKTGGLGRLDARKLREQSDRFEPHAGMFVLDEVLPKSGPLTDLGRIERAELTGFDPSDLVGDLMGIGRPESSILGLKKSFLKG
jgi:hypothetical protein